MVRLQLPPAPPVLRDGVISNSLLFESEVDGANPSPAANPDVSGSNHVWPTPRSRRGRTFPGDQPSPRLPLGEPIACRAIAQSATAGLVAESGVRRSLTPEELERSQA